MIGIRMRMPKSCLNCRFCVHFYNTKYSGCRALSKDEYLRDSRAFELEEFYESKPKWCPLVKVGRVQKNDES